MVDGDEWKGNSFKDEYLTQEAIFRDEYASILDSFCWTILKPFVIDGKEKIDRHGVPIIKDDLEWKIGDKKFQNLPLKIQEAYKKLKNLVDVLEKSENKQIELHKEILRDIFSLGNCCYNFGKWIAYGGKDGYNYQRNPCRENQYKLSSALGRAEENLGESELLEAEKGILDICKKCPYR